MARSNIAIAGQARPVELDDVQHFSVRQASRRNMCCSQAAAENAARRIADIGDRADLGWRHICILVTYLEATHDHTKLLQ